jgi:hypothetical protein
MGSDAYPPKFEVINQGKESKGGRMIEYTVKVYPSGTKYWYLNGKRHREDGPAIETANGGKEWCLNDERHREDGPAVEYANGGKLWYLNGELHREDGPAIEYVDGRESWFLNGKKLTEAEHAELTAPAIEMTVEQICKALGKKVKVVSSEWQTIKSQYQDFKKDEGKNE